MPDSVFTKIVNGELPSHKIYEDDAVLAFMDIHPLVEGHVVVITKQQIEFVWDLPDELYTQLMSVVKKIAVQMREVLPQAYIHERIVGRDVPHAHVQLMPFNDSAELSSKQDMNADPDHAKLASLAEKLRINS